ncbi:MAG: metallophosphoesterase, partial [Actinomycetota bacterium]
LVSSDLHYGLRQVEWIHQQAADFDAVVLSGDHLDVLGPVDPHAQISMMSALYADIAASTTLIANSGNHDLTQRLDHGEKTAAWLHDVAPSVTTDGASINVGPDLVTACAWWEGPFTLGAVERQLANDAVRRPSAGVWIWAYHSPPDQSPTSWSGRRFYGDDVLNRLITEHRPDLVLCGHVHDSPFRAPDGSFHDRVGDTLVLNAGRQPGPIPAHLIVDTQEREVFWWSFEGDETIAL